MRSLMRTVSTFAIGREDSRDHIPDGAEGREVRLPKAHEIDARGPESMEDVDGVLDLGLRQPV